MSGEFARHPAAAPSPGGAALPKSFARSLRRSLGLLPKSKWPFFQRGSYPATPRAIARLLPREMLEEVTIPAPAAPASAEGALAETWRRVGRSHKWMHYFPVYERAFSHLVGRPVRFLEIGVQNGGSLRMWKSYFGEGATIVGIDIDPDCAAHEDPANGIHVRIGSQADAAFLASVVEDLGPFDAVLDDGSHRTGHIVASFGHLFGAALKRGGVYMIEDTHATYWRKSRDIPYSSSDFCLYLANLMHHHYVEAPDARHFFEGHPKRLKEATVPRLATLLESVEILDSLVVVRKSADEPALPVNVDLPPA